jgi:hypothetical protein
MILIALDAMRRAGKRHATPQESDSSNIYMPEEGSEENRPFDAKVGKQTSLRHIC